MSDLFEIRDPDTGAVIERVERKDFPAAARQAMAEVIQGTLERRDTLRNHIKRLEQDGGR